MARARIHAPSKRGPSWQYSNTGARAQHFATVRPENKVCRVCGSHLAVWASGPKARSAQAYAGWRQRGRCEPWCVPGLQVCTPAKRKTARIENPMLARVCSRFSGWVAEIGPRAFAHGLTHRTQLHVTLYTRARVHASRKVTTTCVRCVRPYAKARGPISATQPANRLQTRASIEFSFLAVFVRSGYNPANPVRTEVRTFPIPPPSRTGPR